MEATVEVIVDEKLLRGHVRMHRSFETSAYNLADQRRLGRKSEERDRKWVQYCRGASERQEKIIGCG